MIFKLTLEVNSITLEFGALGFKNFTLLSQSFTQPIKINQEVFSLPPNTPPERIITQLQS